MSVKSGNLKVLSNDEIKKIHLSSLELLEETGVRVPNDSCLKILDESGAKVDFKNKNVIFPAWLVEEKIRLAPSRFTIHAREDKYSLRIGNDRTYFCPAASCINVIDIDGRRRLATNQDAINFTKLCDALRNIDEGDCVVCPNDIPPGTEHLYRTWAQMKYSSKPSRGRSYGKQEALDCIKMAEILAGGEKNLRAYPNIWANISTLSPLGHYPEQLEGMLEYTQRGLPIIISPEAQAGATAPVTIAGLIAQTNAEILSGITLAQIINPGTPVCMGTISTVMDFKRGSICYGVGEMSLIAAANVQMAKFYNIPSRVAGGWSASKCLDMQAGYETMMTLLMAVLAGADYVIGSAGGMDTALAASYEKLLIDDDMINMIGRISEGINLNDSTLALDLIKSIGPNGNFLAERHTVEFMRKEIVLPELASREKSDEWEKAGSKRIENRAKTKVIEILESHTPLPLSEEVDKELESFVKSAIDREIRKNSKNSV
ncbi:MAG: trimethylamine methyltransferase family protein [Actinobacteria bacterium]|nr:trimethylamine methyltransferase family protein [Actinomycetota bacterium]